MASACVNIPISPPHPNTSFLNIPWLSPDLHDSASDFEFRLVDHPISNILPADQLFSNGKLLTSSPSAAANTADITAKDITRRKITEDDGDGGVENYIFSPKAPRCSSRWREILGLKNRKLSTPDSTKTTSLLSNTSSSSCKSLRFSSDEPNTKTTSSSKSLKFSTEENNKTTASSKSVKYSTEENTKTTSSSKTVKFSAEENTKTTSSSKSIKRFLSKSTRTTSSSDTSLSLPLLDRSSDSSSFDSLTESIFSISTSTSRLSLSSLSSSTSSSTHDHDDLHRLSLDETRPRVTHLRPKPNSVSTRPVRRPQKPTRPGAGAGTGVSADSPRMNSAGKIVFQSLNRSSSSPSSFNGGPRYKHRGMERSYSANVRITPVLNVPVCSSLRGSSKSGGFGFGQLFTSSSSSTQKKRSPIA